MTPYSFNILLPIYWLMANNKFGIKTWYVANLFTPEEVEYYSKPGIYYVLSKIK